MTTEPQPFDLGYDYEQDKDIIDRAKNYDDCHPFLENSKPMELLREACRELYAVRLLVKNMERSINDLIHERDEARDEVRDEE